MTKQNANRTGSEYQLTIFLDEMLRQNDFVTYEMVLLKYKGIKDPEYYNTNKRDLDPDYKPLKKAKTNIGKLLKAIRLDFVEKPLENKSKKAFGYPKELGDTDIIADMRKDVKKLKLSQMLELLSNSTGLFPAQWMCRFQLQCQQSILDNDGKHGVVSFFSNENLKNIELLPKLYDSIIKKNVIGFEYKPFDKKPYDVVMHPHFLKEYNNRWFLFGNATSKGTTFPIASFAVDRIVDDIKTIEGADYIEPEVDYQTYFDDVVGVTHSSEAIDIEIETNSEYIHSLIGTKPIIKNQKEIRFFDKEKKIAGKFEIHAVPNTELVAQLLSFGSGIKVVAPESFRKKIDEEIGEMKKNYNE